MKINSLNSAYNFRGATINLNAFSDVHGHIEKTDSAYQALVKNKALAGKKQGANFIINAGDWFVSKGNIDFKDKKEKSFTDYQLLMYNKFIETIRKKYPNTKTVFVPASHEFDGGEELFNKLLKETDSRFVSANLDFSVSPTVTSEDSSDKLTNSTIDFVPDDKNPDVLYPILNIGVSPLNIKSYSGRMSRIYTSPNQIVNEKHYLMTLQAVESIVEDFKSKYPNGIVVVTCHTRTDFAKNLAENSDIDIIFNSHEKPGSEKIGRTQIVNLSKDFDRISNVKITIDDDGKISDTEIKDLYPSKEHSRRPGAIGKYFNKLFGNETKKTHTLVCIDKSINNLNTDGIKTGNNNLANFVTDILLYQIKKRDPDVDIFAINSSSIKDGFNLAKGQNTSNIDILNCLTGISSPQGEIYTTKISGVELAEFILTNLLNNLVDEEKNPIMQYAGIKINKTGMLKDYLSGKNFNDLCRHITLKKSGRMVISEGSYKIANTLKHFQKAEDDGNGILFGRSKATGYRLHDLFREYFEKHEPVIFNTEKRIY